ncbi:MAG: hypothetical protein ACSHX7_01960 [Luteolibacter sp.]
MKTSTPPKTKACGFPSAKLSGNESNFPKSSVFTKPLLRKSKPSGFALIATISLMVLLLVLALGMLSLATVELRSSGSKDGIQIAKSNARMAMMIALGELQKAAGHDQRITATADLTLPASGNDDRRNWVGVWDSSLYDPSTFDPSDPTDNKTFVKWLVSSSDDSSLAQDDASSVTLSNSFKIFDGTVGTVQEANDVAVDKISIMDASGVQTGSYAWWVEDHGVKADISWNQTSETRTEVAQAARLSSAPGADPRVFQDTSAAYNLADNETLDNTQDFIQNLEKVLSASHLPLADSNSGSQYDWLKRYRHDVSVESNAVLSDTKLGGLQRDLSLAFEMDGTAEAENANKFNGETGEFVASGNGERLDSPETLGGLPVAARYLHRDTKSSGEPFSNDIPRADAVVRGPTWWAIRDYANLYKNVSGTSGDYTLEARSYYPNETQGERLGSKVSIHGGTALFDLETDPLVSGNLFIQRPAKANYAPVSLGGTTLISVKAEGTEVVLGLDILFYLWNPYNHRISCDNLVMKMSKALPGAITITKTNGSTNEVYNTSIFEAIGENVTTSDFSFLIKSETGGRIVLEPGEVVIATPSSTQGESNLGFTLSGNSGITLRNLNNGLPINAADGDIIGFRYYRVLGNSAGVNTAGMRNEYELYLPNGSLSLSDLSSVGNFGEELQHLNFPSHALQTSNGNASPSEYFSPETETSYKSTPVRTVDFQDIGNSKIYFGLLSSLTKPAFWEGGGANPVEVFTRFNPNPTIVKREVNRVCAFNQVYNMLCSDNSDELLLQNGIEYSVLERNAFWGASYTTAGSEHVPLSVIPISPLHSLASLSKANISFISTDPFHPVGNSWSSPFVPVDSAYGAIDDPRGNENDAAQDLSWFVNDTLFDRYFFSGIAPYYTINSSGYSLESGASLTETLTDFFGDDHREARANPALQPLLVAGKSASEIVDILDPSGSGSPSDGYKKLAAYSMLEGAFNINSTSVKAWEALLRSNKNMDILYSDGGNGDGNGSPFPGSVLPANEDLASVGWAGFSRLDDDQITNLATEIVALVKERGPFMGLSDFVNRQMGNHEGVIQAAIQNSGINGTIAANAGGVAPIYEGIGDSSMNYFVYAQGGEDRNSAAGLPKEINQAEILLPLAPHMRPRSDTFTIRAYGSALSKTGNVLNTAYCEATIQRVPEYVDSLSNDPWDEPMANPHDFSGRINPEDSAILQGINKTFGRKFKVVGFRWLSEDEI